MVNYKEILKGQISFFAGILFILLISFIVPPIIEAMSGIQTESGIEGIIWFGLIILYVLMGFVMPLYFIYKGLVVEDDNNDPFINILIAVVSFIFNIIITIKGWFMITAFNTYLSSLTVEGIELIMVLFWMGLLLSWVTCVIITPIYTIIKYSTN